MNADTMTKIGKARHTRHNVSDIENIWKLSQLKTKTDVRLFNSNVNSEWLREIVE